VVEQESASRRRRRSGSAPTLQDVAREAGVSPMTVSRVVEANPRVNATMRAKVREAIERLGYAPNADARSLARAGLIRIGVVHANPSASFTSELLVSLFEQSSAIGCQMILARQSSAAAAVARMEEAGVDGVILPMPLGDDDRLHARFRTKNIVTIALGTGRRDLSALSIGIDNVAAAHRMTTYLLDQGHRDIAFILGAASQIDAEQRFQGFANAMREAGLALAGERSVRGDYTYRSGMDCAARLLTSPSPPTAIFASNDDMAAGALAAAHRLGLDVPRHLSIVGFDDTPLATTIWPELTTIRQPVDELAARGLALLIDAIRRARQGESVEHCHADVPLDLTERASVAPPFR
jgi:LacI family transcriptional regulator